MPNIIAGELVRGFLSQCQDGESIEDILVRDYILVKRCEVDVAWAKSEPDTILIGGHQRTGWTPERAEINFRYYENVVSEALQEYSEAVAVQELVKARAKEKREAHVSERRKDLVEEYGYPSFVEAPEAVQDLINKLAEAEYTGKLKDKDLW